MLQYSLICLKHSHFHLGILVVADGCNLLLLCQSALDGFKVLQLQFGVDDFLVTYRVDGAVNMGYVVILKTAQHMDDGVGLADVAKELVAESLALTCAFHESGDIHNLTCCGHYTSWMHQFCQFCKSFVGHCNHAHIGFDSTKRKIRCLSLSARQTIEKGGLAHIGQSNNTTF